MLLNQIVTLAHQAGVAIMEHYQQATANTQYKADDSPLTAADLAAHQLICQELAKITPDIPVLSEESQTIPYSERQHWSQFWLVDPLDGTKEFIQRNGEFTVNIALIENGEPVLGVVHAPALGTSYFASKGGRACRLEPGQTPQRLKIPNSLAQEPLRIVSSRSHGDARLQSLSDYLEVEEAYPLGSSLKLCLVAQAGVQLYPRLGPTMEWDTAAAHCVVSVAGGRVCDLNGEELRYNKPDLHNPDFVVLARSNRVLLQQIQSWHQAQTSSEPAID